MNILLNGEHRPITDNMTVSALLSQLGLTGKRLALEVNQDIVPRSQFDTYIFKQNDNVEIVHAIGGG